MNKKPSLTINAFSSSTNLAVTALISFLLTPFIIAKLGKTGYGIWTLVSSFAGYYGLLNLGVSSAITRYIAKYSGGSDLKSLNKTSSTAITMFNMTGLLVILISFLIAEPLALFFDVKPEKIETFTKVVRVLGLATGLSFPGGVFSAVLTAMERFVPVNITNICFSLLRAGLTVYFLLEGMGLEGVAYATLICAVLRLAVNVILCKTIFPQIKFNPAMASWSFLWTLLTYGGITTIITVANMLRTSIDSLVIGKFVSLDAVGVYGIAALIIRYLMRLIITAMGVLTPRFSSLHGSKNHTEMKELFTKAVFVSAFIACGACAGGVILGGAFINLWVGPAFKMSATVLLILIFAWVTDLAQNPGISLMFALKKHYIYAGLIIVEAITNLTLSIILAPAYGLIGVAMGTFIPMVLIRIFIQPFYIIKIIDLPMSKYLSIFVVPFSAMFVAILLFYASPGFRGWSSGSYLRLLTAAAAVGGFYVLLIRILAVFLVSVENPKGLFKWLVGSNGKKY